MVGEKAVTLVDPVALKVVGGIPLAKGDKELVDDDDLPTEMAVSPDGKRAFVLYGVHNKVVVLDLEAKKAVGMTKTGRDGRKLFGNLMGAMYGLAGYWAAGYSPRGFATPLMLAVRPDGRFAYAINSQTKDVTVVDADTAQAVEMSCPTCAGWRCRPTGRTRSRPRSGWWSVSTASTARSWRG